MEASKGLTTKQVRAFRHHRTTTSAPNVMVSELEAHYRRLSRVGDGNPWKRAFGGAVAILTGGVIGALLTGEGWTPELKAAVGFAAVCLIAWWAIRETEAETVDTICQDYKQDIIDSFGFVEEEE